MINKNNYMEAYSRFKNSGFIVVDARQYYVEGAEMLEPELEQLTETSWKYNGNQIFVYSKTDISLLTERTRGTRLVKYYEYWMYDPNTGSPEMLDTGSCSFADPYGNTINIAQAQETIGEFALASSYLPHVFMGPEFSEARNYINGRMGMPEVTKEDYYSYLDHIESQMKSGVEFVGKIQKPSDMAMAYASWE